MLRIRSALICAALAGAMIANSADANAAEPLTLAQAISRALAYAPAADLARAQTELGDAKVNEARAPLFPSVALNGEYNQAPGYSQIITNRGLTLAQLALDYTVFDGGRRSAQLRAARYAAQAARLGVDATRAQIVFATTVAYFDLQRERATVYELEHSRGRLTQYQSIIENLRGSGRANASETLKIRAVGDAVGLALAAAQQAREHAAIVLGSLIGAPDATDVQVVAVSDLPPQPTGEIGRSPAFRAAAHQLEAAHTAIAAAEAERAPVLKLALTSGFEGIDPPATFDRHLGASYDGAVSVPIFQGGLVRAHIDEARAAQHTALAELRQIELDLKRDYADAIARYRGARVQLGLLGTAQTTADDAFAVVWTRFLGGGNVTLFEVLDAYQQSQNLRSARLDDEFNLRTAAAQAAMILGDQP